MLLMGKLTISMAIFNSYVKLPEGRGSSHLYSVWLGTKNMQIIKMIILVHLQIAHVNPGLAISPGL